MPERRVIAPKGLTLVELMATIFIAALLAALAVPSIRGSDSSASFRKAAEAVREVFEFANAQAISTGLTHRVQIILGSGSAGGEIRVYRGAESVCVFQFGDEDLLVRTVRFEAPGVADQYEVDDVDDSIIPLETTATLTAVLPDTVLTNDLCIKPNGTVRDARLNIPVAAPAAAGNQAAGRVVIQVQGNDISGPADSPIYEPLGAPLKVVVPYSGFARVAF